MKHKLRSSFLTPSMTVAPPMLVCKAFPATLFSFLQRFELWVIPSGKICRNTDLQKVCIKCSKCLPERTDALDELTTEHAKALTGLLEVHLWSCESGSWDIGIGPMISC